MNNNFTTSEAVGDWGEVCLACQHACTVGSAVFARIADDCGIFDTNVTELGLDGTAEETSLTTVGALYLQVLDNKALTVELAAIGHLLCVWFLRIVTDWFEVADVSLPFIFVLPLFTFSANQTRLAADAIW